MRARFSMTMMMMFSSMMHSFHDFLLKILCIIPSCKNTHYPFFCNHFFHGGRLMMFAMGFECDLRMFTSAICFHKTPVNYIRQFSY